LFCGHDCTVLWPSRSGLACLSEATLAAFAEGQIEGHTQGPIEEHLADCDDCRAVLTRAAGTMRSHAETSAVSSADEDDAKDLPSGTHVGRYVVEALIGRGAMGSVYAARDPDLDRKVAVKRLRADALSEAARHQMRARLLREAQAMARLSHPEVITVYDVGAFGDQLFVAMEFVEGETLRQWRAAQHRGYAEILGVYERAGSGLAAAHEAGLVHRDFKPDNVLVGRDGRVRVTDFGLARSVSHVDGTATPRPGGAESPEEGGLTMTLTRTGTLLGTPAYMAPEQLRGGVADARSDVFSFCVALYEALYGERPFAGSTVPAVRASIEDGAVRAPPLMTRVPAWLRAVLLRGLRSAPEQRFASMRALLDGLRAAHAASRWRMRLAIALAAGLLGTVAGVTVYARGAPDVARHEASTTRSSLAANAMAAGAPSHPGDETIVEAIPALETSASIFVARPSPSPPLSSSQPALPAAARRPSALRARAQAPSTAPSGVPLVGNNGALILE
jgi:tRNA A-37 threonylcarbamoyl transferase component Bud32